LAGFKHFNRALTHTCMMLKPRRAQHYMMVSFNLNLSEIDLTHHIRNELLYKILGLGEIRLG
jgi:hypothetical protein